MSTLAFFVGFLAALATQPAGAAEAPTTVLELRLQGLDEGVLEAERGRLLLERVDKEGQGPLVLPLVSVQKVTVPEASRWLTRFEAVGLWGPRVLLDADPASVRVWAFNLRPAGQLAGRLTAKNLPLPPKFFVTSVFAGLGNAESPCSIGDQGAFRCVVPAGRQDVVLAVGAFAPVRFRGQAVEAGKVFLLPPTELLPGATLRGQVLIPESVPSGEKLVALPRVRVFRFVAGAKPQIEAPKPLAEGQVAADGSFAFLGLDPGPVILEVSLPGYSPFRLSPLELAAGTEVSVPDLIELTRPFEVVVEVTPVTDVYGLPWTVVLERSASDPSGFRSLEGRTDAEGRFRAPDQSAGPRRLEIRDSAGNTFHSDRDLWLAPGAEALVGVDLPLVEVSGRVTLADQPQAATLHFGGRRGGRHIEMATDGEGIFEGTLPKAGVWSVGIETAEFSTFTKVTVSPGLDEHRAEVNIELPDTHLFGRVVDEAGQAVAGASVEVSAAGHYQDLVTDSAGFFEAKAIASGVITVAADFRRTGLEPLTSEPQVLDLHEKQPLGPIELRLRSLERRTVKVHRGSYPVAGAVISLRSRDGSRYGDDAISDADGLAQVRVDPRTREWDVLLLAPGATLSAFRRPNDGSPLEFQVEEGGGELTVELPEPLEQILAAGLQLMVLRDDAPIGLDQLVHWRRGLGLSAGVEPDAAALMFPRLASGHYTVCLEPVERLQQHLAAGGQEPLHCRGGRLVPGGSLTLSLPKSSTP